MSEDQADETLKTIVGAVRIRRAVGAVQPRKSSLSGRFPRKIRFDPKAACHPRGPVGPSHRRNLPWRLLHPRDAVINAGLTHCAAIGRSGLVFCFFALAIGYAHACDRL